VVAVKPRRGTWAHRDQAHTPRDAARELAWEPTRPGAWKQVVRRFRDGRTATWWAADAALGGWGPHRQTRLVVATTDPATLPEKATWYLATDLPRPGSPRAADGPYPAADLAEIVRIYGLRNWIEQGYKQVKDELGWADFQVRSDVAIRRHQTLVHCAFSFCWHTGPAATPRSDTPTPPPRAETAEPDAEERGTPTPATGRAAPLAAGHPRGARLADPGDRAHALVAGLVTGAPTG
jgi:hypothetical protein